MEEEQEDEEGDGFLVCWFLMVQVVESKFCFFFVVVIFPAHFVCLLVCFPSTARRGVFFFSDVDAAEEEEQEQDVSTCVELRW